MPGHGKRLHGEVEDATPSSPFPPPFSSPHAAPHLPLKAVSRHLREARTEDVHRIGGGAPVYLSAVLEFLTTSLVDAVAKEAKKRRTEGEDGAEGCGDEAGAEGGANEASVESEAEAAPSTIRPSDLAALFARDGEWRRMRAFAVEAPPSRPMGGQPAPLEAPTAVDDASAAALFPSRASPSSSASRRPPLPSRPTRSPCPPPTAAVDRGGAAEERTSGASPHTGEAAAAEATAVAAGGGADAAGAHPREVSAVAEPQPGLGRWGAGQLSAGLPADAATGTARTAHPPQLKCNTQRLAAAS